MIKEKIEEFEKYYSAYYDKLVSRCSMKERDRFLVEEAVQESFIVFAKKFVLVEKMENIWAWLYVATKYEIKKIRRRVKIYSKYMDKYFDSNLNKMVTTVNDMKAEIIFSKEYLEDLASLMGKEDRKLFNILLYHKLSDSEIAEELGISNKLLSSRKYKLKIKLIELLDRN